MKRLLTLTTDPFAATAALASAAPVQENYGNLGDRCLCEDANHGTSINQIGRRKQGESHAPTF